MTVKAEGYHVPVLLKDSVDGMNINDNSICVDVTFGGGGHSREILSRLGKNGHLYAFDQDTETIGNIEPDKRFTFIHGNFCYLKNFLRYYDCSGVDAILVDLGVSSHHFDDENRGFSFRFEDSALDMRMNHKSALKASDILNSYPEEKLADVFYLYGELKQSRSMASKIVKRRSEKPFEKVKDFNELMKSFIGKNDKEKKVLAQAYQALRIEVNAETRVLENFLKQSLEILKPGGRISVITYHSLEDRLVKNFFKTGNTEGVLEKDFFGNSTSPFKLINNKVIVADEEELAKNPRSRSAKLRIAEKR